MTEIYRDETRFRHPNVRIEADASIVPCAGENEIIPIILAVFPDHGTPAFVGSTIQSRKQMIESANKLSDAESRKLDYAWRTAMEGLLNDNIITSQGVFRSTVKGKPDIYVIIDGDTFKDNSLRLYCHIGNYEGATVLFQDARATTKEAGKIERTFVRDGGYKLPKNWR